MKGFAFHRLWKSKKEEKTTSNTKRSETRNKIITRKRRMWR